MAKKTPASKIPVKRPAKKKPVQPSAIASKPIAWRSWLSSGAKAVALIVCGVAAGVYAAGGVEIGPGPKPSDAVSAVFDEQEATFRALSTERAKALRAGEITSEAASVDWMSSRFLPKAEAAWTPLLTEEKSAFGGKQWTAEKEASHIERYAR